MPKLFQRKTEKNLNPNPNAAQEGSQGSVEQRLRAEEKARKKAGKSKANSRRKAKTAQKCIGYDMMFEDGVCQVTEGVYSKTMWFSDVNYQTAKEDVQKHIFLRWCELLNYFDENATLEVSIINHHVDEDSFKKEVFLPSFNDGYDEYRKEYNQMLAEKAIIGKQNISRDRFLTFSVHAPTYRKALPLLDRMESDLADMLKQIQCETHVLTGKERLGILAGLLIPDEPFEFEYIDNFKKSRSSKDAITPSGFDFSNSKSFMMGERYAQALSIKQLPPNLSDRLVSQIVDLPFDMIVSFQIRSVEQTDAIQYVSRKIAYMEADQAAAENNSMKNGYYTAFVPHELKRSQIEALSFMDDLQNANMHMFKVSGVILTSAASQAELDDNVFQIISTARKSTTTIAPCMYMQQAGMNSALPLGMNHLPIERTLHTASTAIFMPFTTQELVQKQAGAMYYGQNQLSGSFILFDRKSLKTPNGWVFGTPGSGKSFGCKREILNMALGNPKDEIIIIDPENEYTTVVEALGGQAIEISAASSNYLNPFDMTDNYADDASPVTMKSEFILSLCELLVGGSGGLSPITRSVIDRVCCIIYDGFGSWTTREQMPNFKTFYQVLKGQPEPEAKVLAQSLEMYIEGTLSVFAHNTNVNTSARIVSYNTKRLGKQLKTFGMLVTLDQVWNRCTANQERGIRTWVYIDEAQSFFDGSEFAINYFDMIWSRGRKYGCVPTAITQNIERVLYTDRARLMLSNSEFVMMFNQSASDRKALGQLLGLSEIQLSYVTNAKAGCGLLVAGSAVIPFKDKFPKDTKLYKLITTKPEELAEQRELSKKIAAEKVESDDGFGSGKMIENEGPAEVAKVEEQGVEINPVAEQVVVEPVPVVTTIEPEFDRELLLEEYAILQKKLEVAEPKELLPILKRLSEVKKFLNM